MLELKPRNQGNNYWGKVGQPSNPIVRNQEIFASPKVLHDVGHIRLERRVSWCGNPEGWDPMSHIAGYLHRKTKDSNYVSIFRHPEDEQISYCTSYINRIQTGKTHWLKLCCCFDRIINSHLVPQVVV